MRSDLSLSPIAQAFGGQPRPDGSTVAWHYGNPLGEQRALDSGAVIIDRSDRIIFKVSGEDAPDFLNRLLSQKLDDLPENLRTEALDLDMNGRILHHTGIIRLPDAFYLDVDPAHADSFEKYLAMMIFWSKVELERTDLALLTILGEAPHYESVVSDAVHQWPGAARRDLLVRREDMLDVVRWFAGHHVTLAGTMTFDAVRTRAVIPDPLKDLDHKSIPHEVPSWIGRNGRLGAVHLNKGCYRGQETVARVENLGRSPRVLVIVHLDGSAPELPPTGAEIKAGRRTVGRLGEVIQDCDYGPMALALVKRSALGSTELQAEGVAINVDPDSLPAEESEQAGRKAIDRLKGRS